MKPLHLLVSRCCQRSQSWWSPWGRPPQPGRCSLLPLQQQKGLGVVWCNVCYRLFPFFQTALVDWGDINTTGDVIHKNQVRCYCVAWELDFSLKTHTKINFFFMMFANHHFSFVMLSNCTILGETGQKQHQIHSRVTQDTTERLFLCSPGMTIFRPYFVRLRKNLVKMCHTRTSDAREWKKNNSVMPIFLIK